MAEEQRPSIFNKSATERLRSPDDLDKYVRVTNPSAWVVLAGCLCLLAGLLAWGFFGTVATNINSTCAEIPSGEVVCLVSTKMLSGLEVGDPVVVEDTTGTVGRIGNVPLSAAEARELVGSDYLIDQLMSQNVRWVFPVYLDGVKIEDGIVSTATIMTRRISPMEAMFSADREQ